MKTAKIFMNGRSQAVRLPKEFRFEDSEVYINKHGSLVMLVPKTNPWAAFLSSLDKFSNDFMEERKQAMQKRNKL